MWFSPRFFVLRRVHYLRIHRKSNLIECEWEQQLGANHFTQLSIPWLTFHRHPPLHTNPTPIPYSLPVLFYKTVGERRWQSCSSQHKAWCACPTTCSGGCSACLPHNKSHHCTSCSHCASVLVGVAVKELCHVELSCNGMRHCATRRAAENARHTWPDEWMRSERVRVSQLTTATFTVQWGVK